MGAKLRTSDGSDIPLPNLIEVDLETEKLAPELPELPELPIIHYRMARPH